MSSCLSCVPSKPSSRPPAGCRTCTTKAELRGGGCNADITGSEPFTLLQPPCLSSFINLCCCFSPSAAGGRSGDQAPAAASTEATERREEEQTPDQHRGHSGSGGNEIKGTEQTAAAARLSCAALMRGSQRGNRISLGSNKNSSDTFSL